ncbi:MAG: VOC family protein [Proteobacteria bacterium]|nr:VOC family protein [Pseudomonadota bacterium]
MSNAEVRGRFVWHELLTTDTAAAATFYAKVLPWRTQPSNMPGYTIFMAGGAQVGGLMALPDDGGGTPAHWLPYIGTPDVDATVSQAHGLGARICKDATDIPNVGRFAVLADPQGATFAVFTPSAPTPPPQPPQGAFSWHELQTTDIAAAVQFYGQLFGWTKGIAHDMGPMGVYQLFEGSAVGGMCNTQGPSTPPSWLSYVHVADSGRAVAAAKSAGGRLLHGPIEVPGGSWIALFLDPQGGAFAVQEAPRTMSAAKPAATPKATAPAPKPAAAPAPAKAAARKAPAKKAAKPAAEPARKAAPKKAKKAKKAVKKTAKKAKKAKRTVRKAAPKKTARKKAARRHR